jgi:Predicted peptidase
MKYSTLAEVIDLGPFINKIILELEQPISDCSLDNELFQVKVVRKDKKTGKTVQIPKSWGSKEVYPSEGERRVVAAYISDEQGNFSQKGSFITLELEVDPRIPLGSTITFDGVFNVQVDCEYTITQMKPIICGNNRLEDMVFTELNHKRTKFADEFYTGKGIYQGIELGYAAFEPKENGTKRPLLIWLHGAGEGGKDPIIAISGNKVVNLISEDIKQYFGSCYVLGPQAPTMWMDDGSGNYNTDGSSMYVESLKSLLDEFIEAHDGIDRDRIYIGGCSNGGFMTMKMIIAYPEMFAAAYPICEALADEFVTQKDLSKIKNLPIWFTHAKNDPVVIIDKHTEATYKRLIQAGAKDVHFSCFPSVTDRTGKYINEDGTPYEYNGHFSWVPALNNECDFDFDHKPVQVNGRVVTMFEWLSMQKR